jgi:hypothetical protein
MGAGYAEFPAEGETPNQVAACLAIFDFIEG